MKLYDNDAYRDEFLEAVYNLLSDDSSNDRANQVIDLFDAAPAVEAEPTPPNDPLTLEELQKMYGEPVWVRDLVSGDYMCRVIDSTDKHFTFFTDGMKENRSYGTYWLAYRSRPEVQPC